MSTVALSLVLSTIGRQQRLARFLDALDASERVEDVELVVVDQSEDQVCARLAEARPRAYRLVTTTSGRGVSVGRNVGLGLARGVVVGFPDDDCWYDLRTVPRVLEGLEAAPHLAGLSGRLLTGDGRPSALRWDPAPGPVTRTNWFRRSVMAGMFFRTEVVRSAGGFDEATGTGSPGWLQAGEETDLLLRVLAGGGRVHYRPDIVVHHDEVRDAPPPEFVTKALGYGCGQGHLWRQHGLPRGLMAYLLARKVVAAGLHKAQGQDVLARADVAWAKGWLHGYAGRPPRALVRPPSA